MTAISAIIEASEKIYPQINDVLTEIETRLINDGNWPLKKLDNWRTKELPGILLERHKNGDCYLTGDETARLMDWKVTKGKFRAALRKFIRDNQGKEVEKVTRSGIGMFLEGVTKFDKRFNGDKKQFQEYIDLVNKSMTELCKLKGVGPAFSSLVLALLGEITDLAPPFFSDEAFYYYALNGQSSKPKYNMKEYLQEYLPVVGGIVLDNGDNKVTMGALERGGWTLKKIDFNPDLYKDIQLTEEMQNVKQSYASASSSSSKGIKRENNSASEDKDSNKGRNSTRDSDSSDKKRAHSSPATRRKAHKSK